MYESARIYRTSLSALFSKEFLCASQAFLRLYISFSSAVPGRVLVESEPRQDVFSPSRVRLIVPLWTFLHRGGTDLCVFAVCHVAKFISNLSTYVSRILTCHKLNVERWVTNTISTFYRFELLPFTPFLSLFSDIWATEKKALTFRNSDVHFYFIAIFYFHAFLNASQNR